MNETKHIELDDLALYALQFLTPEEASPISLHVEHCTDCRTQLAALQGDLAAYAYSAEMHSPPALARQRLLKAIAREKKVVPIESAAGAPSFGTTPFMGRSGSLLDEGSRGDEAPRRSFGGLVLPWAGWAIAAGLTFAAASLYHDRDTLQHQLSGQTAQMAQMTSDQARARQVLEAMTDRSAMHVTLAKASSAPVALGRATYVPEKGTLIFLASNMDPLETYKVYELWLIPADGRDPIPAGTFHPDARGNASVILPDLPKGVPAKAFGVTIEDEGGSSTPTKPIIMVGE